MTSERTIAVVLAGGVGTRVGLGIPKQLIRIAGKAIVEHTLESLSRNQLIDEILVMMNAESLHELEYLRDGARFPKLRGILPGGKTRNDTTRLALDALPDDPSTKVLFHDAVRPFLDDRIIRDCVVALDSYEAVDTAIPSADTVIQVDDHIITDIPTRSRLRRGQTPQGFRLGTIRQAYELAAGDTDFAATDDCGVVFRYLPNVPIRVVEGSAENMKITEPLDLHIADKIFQLQSAALARPASADIPDLAGKTVVVLGGSYGIGASIADLAERSGAAVHSFGRSTTGTDVTDRRAIRRALARAASGGGIDYVVVTAGMLTISPLATTKRKTLRSTLEVNLLAPAQIAQEAYRYLRDSRGHLLFFTSSSYTRGRAGYSLYSATKAGVVNLTQALADEWSEHGVRVNCINPQRTRTPMRTNAFGEEPAHTLLDPEDVAAVSLKVLEADVTGQIVDVRVAS
ncbi:2-C-methyl-D-erythritol 4-phosphate cytidylyltransferase [Agromyces flavus]|uniref:2-C-methyl-D-erythritol 4-phosphate cytidylyltransferase n=1 Tax=Agromyces flavus TaxID=589382 RepID=A0A1H1UG87_9MICO|nr:bifunctional cytidylyltransferase/SDR family oxidoreductase [Agromyces flavus]MCP2368221.1 2-C-methyl-D-erythritol 4-phosphate cytidylyltransferase [Agromyces flavus]GGI47681.1 pyrophosphorylase [Agromyces flavus]SDS71544.1 2-C-methyl-D-erythritol 4-phosphate cytidylyltransferase [Agromyces flavus]